jgi:hypothetical protein
MKMVMREEEGLISKTRDPPIMLRNCLHWKPAHYDDPNYAAGIVVFDTVTELFRLMPGPAAAATTASRRTSLHDMDGSIGLGCFDEESATAKIWVLEDYEKEVWSFKYQIELPVWSMPHHAYVQRVVLPHSRNMLVCRHSNFFSSCMFHHDTNGNLLEELRWGPWRSSITGHWFKESLVKHAFFPSPSGASPLLFRRLRGTSTYS